VTPPFSPWKLAYWQPIAASYFGRVSTERIVQAVREGESARAAENIAHMKKKATISRCT
jgi:hypothetical protein